LWDALTNQAYADNALQKSMSVAQIMNTWTLQTGFPVIKVVRKYSDGTATLTQVHILRKINPLLKNVICPNS
jgi:aminopeptidase N